MHAAVLLAIAMSASAAAQTPVHTLRGIVRADDGRPVRGVNVFLLETLDGDLSGEDGRFAFDTRASGPVTLVTIRDGYRESRSSIRVPLTDTIVVQLIGLPVPLDPIRVQAGRLAAGSEAGVELNSLDVVTTPGSAADVYRALQTFSGLQTVDEGAGLFVRGGDVFETKIYLDDAVVLSPYRYESPTGGFFGSFDPFLLDGIQFSTGGFGVRWGDALSGVGALSTLGRPTAFNAGVTASLAALSAAAAAPLGSRLGLRATGTRSNTALMFRVNGSTSEFTREPEGRDASGSLVWDYSADGSLKVFGIDQWSQLGVVLDDPSWRGAFEADEGQNLIVASWNDRLASVRTSLALATAGERRTQTLGAFHLESRERLHQLRGHVELPAMPTLTLSAGGEIERRISTFSGQFPEFGYDNHPDAPKRTIEESARATRAGTFVEADWYATPRLRLTGGVRNDRSTLTRRRTWDPRLAAAMRLHPLIVLVGAAGVYHQVASPFDHETWEGQTPLTAMRSTHTVAGVQLGHDAAMLRIEAWSKRYRDLVQQDRDRNIAAGGRGHSRGIDIFAKWPQWQGFSGRTALSLLRARRTDPDTRELARSPFDISRMWTSVLEQQLGSRWSVGLTLRSATGRPFTPIVDANFDAGQQVWVPVYGPPMSERLPGFRRTDFSLSHLAPLGAGRLLVAFLGISNLFDRVNVHDYTYTSNYAERRVVRSQFKRSIYFGVTVDF